MIGAITAVLESVRAFEGEAHGLLATHEGSSRSRVISLSTTLEALGRLSLSQEDLFRQSLLCIERGLYKAAHVMAWAGFMDYLEERLAEDGLEKLYVARPAWKNFTSVEELRENVVEYQLIEVGKRIGLLSKSGMKALHGLLAKRNECAHPSPYQPDLNESLGYVAELINRVRILRTIKP